jgi:protease-4
MKKKSILIGVIAIAVIMVVFVGLIVLVTALKAMFQQEPPAFARGGDTVGVVEITGVIADSKDAIRWINYFVEDDEVKAIVLRIDSPGGGVGASQEIYREVVKAREARKVIVASLGGLAASGGYYVACGADKIMANPGTITGSIGVIMQFSNLEELLKKIGYQGYVIKSGTYKDVGSPFREMTPEERTLLQEVIDTVHQQFIKAVAEGRQLPIEQVAAIADGRIFSGEQARALGLVDELGNLEDTIAMAATMAGIEGRPSVVFSRKRKPSLFDYLTESVAQRLKEEVQETAHPGLNYIWYQ